MEQGPLGDLDELGKEIDRLWAKVASPSTASYSFETSTPPLSLEDPSRQMAWETVELLKKQHRRQSDYWNQAIEAREDVIKELRQRLGQLERENASLQERLQSDENRLLDEGLKVQSQLEAAMASFEAERRRQEEDERSLRALLDQTRQRLAAEDARWRAEQRQWEKKEQQFLLDLQDHQAAEARLQQESGQSVDEARRLAEGLKEAKNALEKTLAELLRERQVRQQSESEREKAVKKVDEVQRHLDELSRLWDEERAQWRELWDRERSTWETQRQEFAGWEERLRKERESWHAELESKEKDQLRFTEQMTRALRETSELSTKVTAMLRGGPAALPRLSRRARWFALALLVLAFVVPPAWRYARKPHFKVLGADPVALNSPTALAFDGATLWLSDWNGRIAGFDPGNLEAPLRAATPVEVGSYRPVSLAFGGEFLWSLDASQARVLRHQGGDPRKVLATRPSPGPAPTALAFDGRSLWSYDASNRTLYQHGADEGASRSFALGPELVVTAMAWVDGRLWVYDSKSRHLVDFELRRDSFRERDRYPFNEAVIGLTTAGGRIDGRMRKQLWILVGPSGQRAAPALIRFSY